MSISISENTSSISFLNNAWWVDLIYWPEMKQFVFIGALEENGDKWWDIKVWRMHLIIKRCNLYMQNIMARGSSVAAGEKRKWKCGAKEMKLENWDSRHRYGVIRQEQRWIKIARDRLLVEEDVVERNRLEYEIELRLGTLAYMREETT